MGVKVFDFDGDGRLDLLVTDMHSDMWVNIPAGDWAAEANKADSSQAPADYFPGGKDRFIFGNALFANRGGGRFEEVSDAAGVETYWPWGPSVDDLNADGWDDIFVAAGAVQRPRTATPRQLPRGPAARDALEPRRARRRGHGRPTRRTANPQGVRREVGLSVRERPAPVLRPRGCAPRRRARGALALWSTSDGCRPRSGRSHGRGDRTVAGRRKV